MAKACLSLKASSSRGSLLFGKDSGSLVSPRYYPSIPLPNLTEVTQLMEEEKGEGKEGEDWTKRDRQSCHIIFVLRGKQTTTPSQL